MRDHQQHHQQQQQQQGRGRESCHLLNGFVVKMLLQMHVVPLMAPTLDCVDQACRCMSLSVSLPLSTYVSLYVCLSIYVLLLVGLFLCLSLSLSLSLSFQSLLPDPPPSRLPPAL